MLKNFHAPLPPKFLQETFDKWICKPGIPSSHTLQSSGILPIWQHKINSKPLQRKLLFEQDVTIDKAIEIALAYQQTTQGAQKLKLAYILMV